MKSLLLLSVMFAGIPLAQAASLCPQGSTQISACVADAVVPVYPFVSICQDQSGYNIVMDAGGLSSPDLMPATRQDSDAAAVFTVKESDDDGVTISIEKNGAKPKAQLSYKMLGSDISSKYTCSALAQ